MTVYKIYLNGYESVLNIEGKEFADPYDRNYSLYGFSSGRSAQKAINDHKRACIKDGYSLENLTYTVVKGSIVPFEEEA